MLRWAFFGLAVPNAPAQTLDLRDNHRLGLHPAWFVSRQSAGGQLRVLQPHGDVEPIEDRGLRDPGIGQDRPQTWTAVGECGHLGVVSSADGFKVSADQRRDVGTSLRDRAEHLSPSGQPSRRCRREPPGVVRRLRGCG